MPMEFLGEDGVVDCMKLGATIGKAISRGSLRDTVKMGGMSGDFKFLDVTLTSGETLPIALKQSPTPLTPHRQMLGLAREALFYTEMAPFLAVANIPQAYFAEGNMETGEMLILLECLEDAVPSGVFFGAGNPNNWEIRDRLPALCEGNPSMEAVSADAFKLYARLHGTFWRDPALLEKPWLRGSNWANGQGEEAWQGAQKMASDGWGAITAERADGTTKVKWDAHLVACLDASFGKVKWETFQTEFAARAYTLVHGDAHPHNALWTRQRTDAAKLALIDFEMVGVGSPAQELGQYVISHMPPDVRRRCERDLVTAYHTELCQTLKDRGCEADAAAFTVDMCWAEYVAGGVGRWAWFVPFFRGNPSMAQYFHDQLAAFLHDHVADPATSPMPRV